ncbi:MAG: hypothetical protein H0V21_09095, partial [Rubrobacter sp.]|nr:hypothetical protein [Rubrobacter sp.]
MPEVVASLKAHRVRQNEERLKVAGAWEDNGLVFPTTGISVQEGDRYDCDDFKYQEDAQKVFDRHPGDPYGLDGPIGPASEGRPGVACEDRPHRLNPGGPADDQYSKTPPSDVNNPDDVIPNTGADQIPDTGGPPYL